MAGLELDVSYAARRPWVPPRPLIRVWVRAALAGAGGGRVVRVSVRIVGAARSRSLNAHYRGKDRATNVLSFGGAGAMPAGPQDLGELVICAPVVAREAREQGKTAKAHWAHLTVHGVLHLLGFDHERPRDGRLMELREIQILDRLGFSDPYS